MAEFEVLIERVASVADHPNADRLSLVGIRGYTCVSAKLEDGSHRYKPGDLVVYVPEGAVVPEWLLRKGFWNEKDNKGMLAGSKGDRVKAIKLRDVLSQGILFSVNRFSGYDYHKHFVLEDFDAWSHHVPGTDWDDWLNVQLEPGVDVSELLGITKYEPPVPQSMSGEAVAIGIENTFHFDIENIKKYPNVLEGHEVVAEEKIHGTCMVVGILPRSPCHDNLINGEFVVSSKGLFGRGISIKDTEENRLKNVYLKAFYKHGLDEVLRKMSRHSQDADVFILGEVYGAGIQDLTYSDELGFRAFGVRVREDDGTLKWLDVDVKYYVLDMFGVERPPVLYRGPYSLEMIQIVTSGTSSLDDKTLKEGVVVTPVHEFEDRYLGRAIVKSVSPEYLLRKGGTEYT